MRRLCVGEEVAGAFGEQSERRLFEGAGAARR